jgi:2-succinyl-5-enolpyruvyl-6-hydroxy-3-cyclohexene-1-carboxylate synthase
VVLHIGEPVASRITNEWLTGSGAYHVHLAAVPKVQDHGHVMSQWVTAPVGSSCHWLASRLRGASGTTWAARWRRAELVAREAIGATIEGTGVLTEPAVARTVVASLGVNGVPPSLVVSSSMPIRDVEWYTQPAAGVYLYSNRGANGIDGVVATGIGVALAAGTAVVLIGDVAFLHDSSSLTALARRNVDLRIVVIDNDGGGIFSFLAQAGAVAPERFERLFGTPHGTDLPALARAHGLSAVTVSDASELVGALREPGPSVIVVRSDRAANVAAHQRINRAVHDALR